jgi:drug/metabolite transporter (DMT)-like permease
MSDQSDVDRSERRKVFLALVGTILVWGCAFAAIRVALRAYSPGEMALLRFLFASGALAIYAVITRMRMPSVRDLPGVFVLGFLGFGFYMPALNFGERTVPAGIAGLLIATIPVFTALLAVAVLGERLGVQGWVGVLMAFAGVALIVAGQQRSLTVSRDALFILSAAVSAAGYFVLQRPFLKRYAPLELTTYAIWAGTLMLLVFSPRLPAQVRAAPLRETAAVAYLGVFAAAAGYVMWNYAMSKMPVARGASYLYLMPVVAMTCGIVVLGEFPTMLSLCGGPVAICGVYLVNTRRKIAVENSNDTARILETMAKSE